MDETMPMNPEPEFKKRQRAMVERLKKMPKTNPLIKVALKKKEAHLNEEDVWKQFELVDELMSAARKQVTDGEPFKKVIKQLSEALESIVDTGGNTDNNG